MSGLDRQECIDDPDYYSGKKVLIAGGSGFIGQNLAAALVRRNARVYSMARRLVRSSGAEIANPEHVACNLADRDEISKRLHDIEPDVIVNAAAATRMQTAQDIESQWMVTANGAITLALEAQRCGVPLMIQIGSSEEYGDGPVPFVESQPDKPISSYSQAKVAVTRFLLSMESALKFPAIVVRPTVAYGPLQTGEMFLPHLFSHYLAGQEAQLSPCQQTRDFIYIDDLVSALVLLGQRIDLSGQIFNVSCGKGLQLKPLVEMVAEACRYSGATGIGKKGYRDNEVMEHFASHERLTAKTGWQPRIDIQEGIKRTAAWWQTYLHPAVD